MNGQGEPHPARRPSRDEQEVLLLGGTANEGRVVRVGETVRRPQRSWSAATHALLRHLEAVGFTGAPRFLGVDGQGREVLSYVPGASVVPPYPAWALTEQALTSVAELLRAYHRAVASFDPSPHVWPPSPPEAYVEDVVSHNDPNLDNVVFRGRRAVALIDFDLASPGSRAWDVACAARLWAPLRPDSYITDARRGRALDRFRLFVDGYGIDTRADRLKVVRGVRENYAWFYDLIRNNAARGHEAFARYWASVTEERAAATIQWYVDHDPDLRAALGV